MSTIKAFLLGGAMGTVVGGVVGGIIGGKLGRFLAEREAKSAMRYMGIQEVTEDVVRIQKSFEEYADDFGKRMGEQLGPEVGKQFADKIKQKCFLNDREGNIFSENRELGGKNFAQVPLLRNSYDLDDSEWYLGPESERSSIFEFFDRYYELKGDKMDKHLMIVRFLDNMTFMIMNYLQVLEQCPGDKFEKAIAVMETEYGTLMHNFLAGEAKERDSEILKFIRGVFEKVDLKILELKKEKLGRRLQEGYTKRFEEAKATQKNLTVLDTAQKLKETLNKQATGIHEFLLRGLARPDRPDNERMTLDQLSEGVARGNLDEHSRFDDSIIGKIVKAYARNLNGFFPRVNEENQSGKIRRFNEHYEEGRLDSNVGARVDTIIRDSHKSVSREERELYLKLAEILNSLNTAYALQSDLLLDLERYGSAGMLATGELEFRQANAVIFYERALDRLKELVANNKEKFFPAEEKEKIKTIPDNIQRLFGLPERAKVNQKQGTALAEFLANRDADLRIFKEEMDKKIRSILEDKSIEKVPQFTQNAGSYMSELAVMCAHDPELLRRISASSFNPTSKATDRLSELKEKLAKVEVIRKAYSELSSAYEGISTFKAEQFKEGTDNRKIFDILNRYKSEFNFNRFGNLDSITKQIASLDVIIRDLNEAGNYELQNYAGSEQFKINAKNIYLKLRDLRNELSNYKDSYGISRVSEDQYNRSIERYAGANRELQGALHEAGANLSEVRSENSSLSSRIKELEEMSRRISEALAQASASKDKLSGQLSDLRTNFESRDKEISEFTQKFTQLYKSNFERQLEELKSIQQEISKPDAKIGEEYKEHLVKRLDVIKRYMEEDFNRINQLVAEYQEKLKNLNIGDSKILDSAVKIVGELGDMLNAAKATVEQLKKRVEELSQVVQVQQKQIEDLQRKLEEYEKRGKEVDKEMKQEKSEKKKIKSEYTVIKDLIRDVLNGPGQRYVNTEKYTVLQQLQQNIITRCEGNDPKNRKDISDLLIQFIAIAMQSRSKLGIFSSAQTTTGKFILDRFNLSMPLKGLITNAPNDKLKYEDIVRFIKSRDEAMTEASRLLRTDREELTVAKKFK